MAATSQNPTASATTASAMAGHGDIAIVGMSCLFPGAADLATYWQNIVDKVDCISDPPADWGGQYAYDPTSPETDRIYTMRGGYLGELSRFDPLEHGIMPKAVDGAEPEHFLALRVASEALKDAGYPDIPLNKDRTEVILGRGTYVNRALVNLHQHGFVIHQMLELLRTLHPTYPEETLAELKRQIRQQLPPFDSLTAAGVVSSIMSGRIANRLDLNGANYCLDAACASSLIAVEHAVRDLRLRTCDAAIVGGVQLSANHLVLMVFCQLGALSREGRIRPFDAGADGTLLGEGVGMVVLKRREDAEREGNRIYAVIKGAGSASDGRAKSIVAPRIEGEVLAIQRAYADAGVSPDTVELIEAHGTSIPLGDHSEIEALGRVFGLGGGRNRYGIGSVKSMIGHLIPAAGIAALIKTALALYERTLPATLNCDEPDPGLGLHKTRFYVNTQTRPWIHASTVEPRRAGVSAFGFGGINAHVVLEEHPASDGPDAPTHHRTWDAELCVVSGSTRDEMIQQAEALQAFIAARPDVPLRDIAYTLNTAMAGRPHRLAIMRGSTADLSRALAHGLKLLARPDCRRIKDRSGIFYFEQRLAEQGKVAFLFPGEGAQYTNMLADLCVAFPEVRACFDLTDRAFIEEGREHVLSQVLFPPPTGQTEADLERQENLLWDMEQGVQAVTTANRALHRLLRRLEIRPDVVLGHSSGEFGALEAAGAIPLETDDAVVRYILAGKRSVKHVAALADTLPEAVLVAASPEDPSLVKRIVDESAGELTVAIDNCPFQVVVCGSPRAAQQAIRRLNDCGVVCTTLPFRRPYHTAGFAPACTPLVEFFRSLDIAPPGVPVYSCATASEFPTEPQAIRQVAVEQWTRRVRFRETIERMHDDGVRLFVEVGPRGNLVAFVNDILRDRPHAAVPVNVQHQSGLSQLQYALGMLAAHGVSMNLAYLYERRGARRLDLADPASAAPANPAARMPKLNLSLPIVHLDPDKRGRESFTAGVLPPGSLKPQDTAHGPVRQDDLGGDVHGKRLPTPLGASAHEPVRQDDLGEDAHKKRLPTPFVARRASQAVAEYFRTMDQFLQSQQEIMTRYFQHRRSDSPADGEPGRSSTDLPFIASVLRHVPGQEAVLRRDLDLTTDIFLHSHMLGGRVSMLDPTLEALPVMPLTMSMEMIAEAAAFLVPDQVVVAMKDVRAHRWIVLENDRLGLIMHARRLNEREIRVEMREADAFEAFGKSGTSSRSDMPGKPDTPNKPDRPRKPHTPGKPNTLSSTSAVGVIGVVGAIGTVGTIGTVGAIGTAPPIIEGTIVMADAWPAAPAPDGFALRDPRPSRFAPGNVYTTGMFNGPCFQAIRSVEQWADNGSLATLQALPADRLFRFNPSPRFVIDPVLLDAAGQQAAHWNAEADSSGFNFFPYRFDELRIYGPPLDAPAHVQSRLKIEQTAPGQYRSDIELIDADGRMRYRLLGWEDREFALPRAFYGIRHDAPEIEIGTLMPGSLPGVPDADAFEICRVDEFSKELLLNHGKIWLKVLAWQVLSRAERGEWRAAAMGDLRQLDWLLGRAAAKQAVRKLLARRYGLALCPADIPIRADDRGRPYVAEGVITGLSGVPRISIAHTTGIAVAIAADNELDVRVGIDIERVRQLEDGFVRVAFGPVDQTSLAGLTPVAANERMLRMWCAKEAAAKAIGLGLQGRPRSYVVTRYNVADGQAEVQVATDDDSQAPASTECIHVATTRQDDLVMALATMIGVNDYDRARQVADPAGTNRHP